MQMPMFTDFVFPPADVLLPWLLATTALTYVTFYARRYRERLEERRKQAREQAYRRVVEGVYRRGY